MKSLEQLADVSTIFLYGGCGYVYGFGASVAILGSLFKIMHFPGAGVMLVAGLGVEAIIFALSSFEPPHETPDWTLVYPELLK